MLFRSGDTTTVTFTFGEPVTNFTLADVTAPNGTFGALSAPITNGDGTQSYTATFTPTVNIEDTTNVVTVDMTGVNDASSTAAGVGTVSSANYTEIGSAQG